MPLPPRASARPFHGLLQEGVGVRGGVGEEAVEDGLRGKGRPSPPRPYAQRKPRGYEAKAPRDLVQVDTLSVTLGPGEVVKHFSALDLATRFSMVQVHGRATASLAAKFLAELVSRAPFPIRAIQGDPALCAAPAES